MSVKKLLILAAAGIASVGATAALAGGPDQVAMPAAPVFQPYVYIQGDVGYVHTNWEDYAFGPFHGSVNNGKGGITAGGALGYQATRFVGMEVGAMYLKNVDGENKDCYGLCLSQWLLYFAGKLTVPVADNFGLFGKVGIGYRGLNWSGKATSYNSSSYHNQYCWDNAGYWTVIFATGLVYHVNDNWDVKLQWMHVPGNTGSHDFANRAPAANLYTFGIDYKFAV